MCEERKTFLMSKCIIGVLREGVMQYFTQVFGDPYYDESIYFVVFVTYMIVLPILSLLMKKLPKRLTQR